MASLVYSPKALANGQLAAAKATLYTVPALTFTIVKSITLVNTDASARTVNLYVKPAATSRRIIPLNLSIPAGGSYVYDDGITLEAGDVIEGDASVANVVDYVINGTEGA